MRLGVAKRKSLHERMPSYCTRGAAARSPHHKCRYAYSLCEARPHFLVNAPLHPLAATVRNHGWGVECPLMDRTLAHFKVQLLRHTAAALHTKQ